MIEKFLPFRSNKLRGYAAQYSCMNPQCKRKAGADTVVLAHYHGSFGHYLGKGVSCKATDFAGAYFCDYCHAVFDERIKVPRDELNQVKAMFWVSVARTHNALANDRRLVLL